MAPRPRDILGLVTVAAATRSLHVPVEKQPHQRHQSDGDEEIVFVQHASHLLPVLAELVAGQSKGKAPRQRAEKREA